MVIVALAAIALVAVTVALFARPPVTVPPSRRSELYCSTVSPTSPGARGRRPRASTHRGLRSPPSTTSRTPSR